MKIVVDVVNGEKVKALTAEIQKQEQQIKAWNAQMQAGTISQQQFEAKAGHAAKSIQTANVQLKELSTSSASAGRGLSQLSYAVDDIQYGFNAIVNNIPQIVMGLGGGAGLAGAVGIAAVAINQLVKHWGEVTDAFQAYWAGGSIEQLTALREKAEEATKAFEKLAETPTKAKAAAGGGISGLITEGPTEKILKDTAEAVAADPMLGEKAKKFETSKIAEQIADWFGIPLVEDIPGATKLKGLDEKARKEAEAKNIQTAKELLGAASQGDPQAMLKLEALVKRHPGAFPDEFMQDIKDQTPEGQKRIAQQRLEAQGERNARKMGEEEKERLEKERIAQNRLEIEGRANAKKSDKETTIRSLEDERTRIKREQEAFDEQMWKKQHEQTRGSVFAGGGKELLQMYQAGAPGGDDPKALAKQAHEQRLKTNKLLEGIDDKLKEARRVIIKN